MHSPQTQGGQGSIVSPQMPNLSLDGTNAPGGMSSPVAQHRKPTSGGMSMRRNGAASFITLPSLPPISSLHSPTFTNQSLSPALGSPYELQGGANPFFQVVSI